MTFEDLPPMEVKCDQCDGKGSVHTLYVSKDNRKGFYDKPCIACSKKGMVLTPFGVAILKLVEKWTTLNDDIESLRDYITDYM